LGWLVVFLGLTPLYLILYPFDFRPNSLSAWLSEWDIHKINTASNLLLFLPFALVAAWRGCRSRPDARLVPLKVTLVAAMLSLTGETLQMWIDGRQSSAIDWLANTAGAGLGAILGVALTPRLSALWDTMKSRLTDRPHMRHLLIVLAIIFFIKAVPFNFSLETYYLRTSWQQTLQRGGPFEATRKWSGSERVRPELSRRMRRELGSATVSFFIAVPLALVLSRAWRERRRRRGLIGSAHGHALVSGIGLILAYELIQWPVRDRVMDMTDPLAGMAGLIVGLMIDAAYAKRSEPNGIAAGDVVDVPDVEVARPDSRSRQVGAVPARTLSVSWKKTATLFGVLCGFSGIALYLAARLPGMPYNVHDLLTHGGWLEAVVRNAVLTAGLLLVAGVPGACAAWCGEDRRRCLLAGPVLVVGALIAAGVLVAAAPRESVEDVVGNPKKLYDIMKTPETTIGWFIESWLRMAALLLVPMSMLLLATAWWESWRRGGIEAAARAVVALLLPAAICAYIGRTVVIDAAVTDNVTELIHDRGGLPAEAYLAGAMLLLATTAGLLAVATGRSLHGAWRWAVAGLVAAVVTVLPAYVFFRLATVAALHKYETTFSAAQFLFGADRQTTLEPIQLFIRWCVAYLLILAVLGIAAGLGLRQVRPSEQAG